MVGVAPRRPGLPGLPGLPAWAGLGCDVGCDVLRLSEGIVGTGKPPPEPCPENEHEAKDEGDDGGGAELAPRPPHVRPGPALCVDILIGADTYVDKTNVCSGTGSWAHTASPR